MDLTLNVELMSRYKWNDVQNKCPVDKIGLEDLAAAALTLNLCYYPLVLSFLSCTFALVLAIESSFDSSFKKNEAGELSWSARFACRGLFVLYLLLLVVSLVEGWHLSWTYVPIHELVFYGSQLLFWPLISFSIHNTQHYLHSTQLRIWWLSLIGFSLVGIAAGIVKGSLHKFRFIFDVALFCVPLLSSLFFLAQSFKGSGSRTELDTPLLEDDSTVGDSTAGGHTGSGFTHAGLFSRITFMWLNPLLTTGNQKPLNLSEVPRLDPEDENQANFDAFQKSWAAGELANSQNSQAQGHLPSIWRALWKTFGVSYLFCFVLSLISSIALLSGPILQNLLIDFVNEEERSYKKGLALVAILFTGKLVESSSKQQFNFRARKLGLRMWSAVGCAVYRKTLRLSQKARQERSVGQITNMLSSDVQCLLEFAWYLGQGFALPFQVVVAVVVLFSVVGVSMVAGLVVVIVVLGLNTAVVRRMRGHRLGLLKAKDSRMHVTTECLGNMKVVKLQAWDEIFREKILKVREEEKSWLQKYVHHFAITVFLMWTGPLLVAAVTFTLMVLRGELLTTAKVFTALTTIRIIQQPIRVGPDIFSNALQAAVSLQRVRVFLCEDEIDDEAVEVVPADKSPTYSIDIQGARFVWDVSEPLTSTPAFSNLSLKIRSGECVAVCGAVGSGKSTLLYSMLGEIPRTAGTARRSGRCAYVAQTAWIQNNSIRENILFGREFDSERYSEAVRVSALEADLTQMPDGDATEIGEKGINLSGGQKQRVQLARAVYDDADVYLLDDPFSAVDAHTGTFLFQECIQGALKGKTVILVTHQVEFLPAADLIIVMKNGEIVQKGSYSELVQEGKYFSTFVEALRDSLDSVAHVGQNSNQGVDKTTEFDVKENSDQKVVKLSSMEKLKFKASEATAKGTIGKGKLIKEEERREGRVDSKLVWMYATKSFYGISSLVVILLQFTAIGSQVGSDFWMAWGTSHGKGRSLPFAELYFVFVIACSLSVLVRACLVVQVGVWTAQDFFNGMLDSIIRAPMSYIDSTPLGRILSRSSTDQSLLDLDLPMVVSQLTNTTIYVLALVMITTYVTPQILGIVILLSWVFLKLQVYYVKSARELSRLTAINEAPVFLHVNETISGASTIRAFEVQSRFKETNSRLFSNYQQAYFHNLTATSWIGIRLESVAAILLSSAAFMLTTLPKDAIPPGMAGLSLSYGLALSGMLQMLVTSFSQLENKMVAVERIDQYSKIKSQAPAIIPNRRPPVNWPTQGHMELQNLQIRYRPDTPLVLKGISCVIQAREKVGVVGRTGSGKSTLIQALFRLIEPAGGRILIDGVDIATIGLHDLRSRLGVIPQEPTLFEGTIRSNLDFFSTYTDQQLWEALEKCALAPAVRAKPDGLDASVSEQGENWSLGERQLLCLGRALLKHARILILDEATASVDISTDAIIQSTIKRNCTDCTIISVAHRIPTVIDSDRVLVLDAGYMMENNSPERLLANENSLFSKLVQEYRATPVRSN